MSVDKKDTGPKTVESELDKLIRTLKFNNYNLDNYHPSQRKIENLSLDGIANNFSYQPLQISAHTQDVNDVLLKATNALEGLTFWLNKIYEDGEAFNSNKELHEQGIALEKLIKKLCDDIAFLQTNIPLLKNNTFALANTPFSFLAANTDQDIEKHILFHVVDYFEMVQTSDLEAISKKIPQENNPTGTRLTETISRTLHAFKNLNEVTANSKRAFEEEFPPAPSNPFTLENENLDFITPEKPPHEMVINSEMKLLFYSILRNIIGTKKPLSVGNFVTTTIDAADEYAQGASGQVGPSRETQWVEADPSQTYLIGKNPSADEIKIGLDLLSKVKAKNKTFHDMLVKHIQRLLCERYYNKLIPQYTCPHDQALMDLHRIIGKNEELPSLIDEMRDLDPTYGSSYIQNGIDTLRDLVQLEINSAKHGVTLWPDKDSPLKFSEKLILEDYERISKLIKTDAIENIKAIDHYLEVLKYLREIEKHFGQSRTPLRKDLKPDELYQNIKKQLNQALSIKYQSLLDLTQKGVEADAAVISNASELSSIHNNRQKVDKSYKEISKHIECLITSIEKINNCPYVREIVPDFFRDNQNNAEALVNQFNQNPGRERIYTIHDLEAQLLDNTTLTETVKLERVRAILFDADAVKKKHLLELLEDYPSYSTLRETLLNELKLEQTLAQASFEKAVKDWESQFEALELNASTYFLNHDKATLNKMLASLQNTDETIKIKAQKLHDKIHVFRAINDKLIHADRKNLSELVESRNQSVNLIRKPDTQQVIHDETDARTKWSLVLGLFFLSGTLASPFLAVYSYKKIGTPNFFKLLSTTTSSATTQKAVDIMDGKIPVKPKHEEKPNYFEKKDATPKIPGLRGQRGYTIN